MTTTVEPVINLQDLLEGIKAKYALVQKELDQGKVKGYVSLKDVYPTIKITDFNLDKIKELAVESVKINKFLKHEGIEVELKLLEIATYEMSFKLTMPLFPDVNTPSYFENFFGNDGWFLEAAWDYINDNITTEQDEVLVQHGNDLVFISDVKVTQL